MKKRNSHDPQPGPPRKKARVDDSSTSSRVSHPVLKCYFKEIVTLRTYLTKVTSRLSRRRREALSNLSAEDQSNISTLLDTVVVATNNPTPGHTQHDYANDLALFSQHLPRSTLGSASAPDPSLQYDVVDYVIWLLFRRCKSSSKPADMLCQGFERASTFQPKKIDLNTPSRIPGIYCQYTNPSVREVTNSAWCQLLSALGRGGDLAMVDILLHCSLFIPSLSHEGLQQISGVPITQLQLLKKLEDGVVVGPEVKEKDLQPGQGDKSRQWSAIRFVRSRMFYAKSTLKDGKVRLGLRNIHAFNRLRDKESDEQTVHLMKYMFPRQFGLHNVFTCEVNSRETAQPFNDYTFRERETANARARAERLLPIHLKERVKPHLKIPKRLRGQAFGLVHALRRNHAKCAYVELLRHYCPVRLPEQGEIAGATKVDPTSLATSHANVSAFCRQVIRLVFPDDFWDSEDNGNKNRRILHRNIDRFVGLRKGESVTLQDVLEEVQISKIPWLQPPNCNGNMAKSDFEKRKEIFAELVYYLFDSFLIPLIRSNFHVTESNAHRNRLFYFRHDVWRRLTEPKLAELKADLFTELKPAEARDALAQRKLGYSAIRLLPKATGFRPIANLRRRMLVSQNGKRILGRSINSILNPVFKVLNHEKMRRPKLVGSSLFSVGDIYPRLRAFKAELTRNGHGNQPLYFAKVDVSACFDTIPQHKMLELVADLVSAENYQIDQHALVKASQRMQHGQAPTITAPRIKFRSEAHAPAHLPIECNRDPNLNPTTMSKYKRISVGPLGQQTVQKKEVMAILEEHITQNLVKIGKKYYQQKNGIPQGSIISSLLCNLFYGQLEREMLMWDGQYLLMRLIDDFLLIATDCRQAIEFVQLLHRGIPEYGVTVKLEKSLVNFEVSVDGRQIPQLKSDAFPYCGVVIDTSTLELKKNSEKQIGGPADALTVEHSIMPGRTFHRKAINAFKIKMHAMFLDTNFNSVETVASNLYKSFFEAAHRMLHYIRCLSSSKQPPATLIIDTIRNLTRLAWRLMQRQQNMDNKGSRNSNNNTRGGLSGRGRNYDCSVRNEQMRWLCCKAFSHVFQRHQSGREELLSWLEVEMQRNWPKSAKDAGLLRRVMT